MTGSLYLSDTSTAVLREQHATVRQRVDQLVIGGRLVMCQMTVLEVLNNAPSPKQYETMWAVLHGQRWLDTDTSCLNRALDVHRKLARSSGSLTASPRDPATDDT